MNTKKKAFLMDKFRMILFIAVLGLVSAGLLVAVNHFTAQKVQKNEELSAKSSVMKVFGIKHGSGDIEAVFDKNVKVVEKSGYTFYLSKDNDIAFEFSGPGLWGDIGGIIALDSKFESIIGVQVLEQEETPGLGGRITESWFLDQFRGKKAFPSIDILPASAAAAGDNQVDGISGATMTCDALEALINQEIAGHKEVWNR
jgi:Na+-transporting NADH:ubiquinone oxidoreductase subunit C